MIGRRRVLACYLALCWAAASFGCDLHTAESAPRKPQALQGFTPPAADGWGEAAGLRYLEVLRGGARPQQRLPLLIVIHGLGGQASEQWGKTWASELQRPLRVVLPQAPTPHFGGYAWFDYRVSDQAPDQLAQGIQRAAAQLAEALSLLQRGRPTLGKPVVSGFSQGGMLSYALALHHAELLRGAVPVSGLLPRRLWPSRKPEGKRLPPIVALHGGADGVVPIEPARALIGHLTELGHSAQLREFAGVGHEVTPAMDRALSQALAAALERGVSGVN